MVHSGELKSRFTAYLDEFTVKLRDYVVSTFKVCEDQDSDETKAFQEQIEKLVGSYGVGVLPPELIVIV